MKKILFVDKDDFYIKLYKKKLGEKIEFISARDGEEAFKKIKEEKPDLVVTEILIPFKDGFKLIKETKKIKELSGIPFIILTTLNQEVDRKEGNRVAEGYFVKEEDSFSQVVEKMRELLGVEDKIIA